MSCRLMVLIATRLAGCTLILLGSSLGASEARLTSGVVLTQRPSDETPSAHLAQASLASPSSPLPLSPPSFELGVSGPEVAQLQALLRRAGYYNDEIDGVYGDQTRFALIEFQRQLNLEATGDLNDQTWQALQELHPGFDTSQFSSDSQFSSAASGSSDEAIDAGASPDEVVLSPEANSDPAPDASAGAENAASGADQDWLRSLLLVSVIMGVAGTVAYALMHYGLIRIPRSRQVALLLRRLTTATSRSSEPIRAASTRRRIQSSGLGSGLTSPSLDQPQVGEAAPTDASSPDEPMLMRPTRVTPPSQAEVVHQLTRDLYHPEPSVRRQAIWELGQQGDADVIAQLTDLMAASDSHQRCLLLAAISEIGIRTLKPINRALIGSLHDENVEVRKNAIREITRIYDLVTQVSYYLRHAVDDADAEVRKTAQWALGRIDRTLAQSDTTLPDLSTLVQSSGAAPASANVELSAINRSLGDRPPSD